MCGIFGYASLRPPDPFPDLRAVFGCMAYRGPDARGLYLSAARAPEAAPATLLHDPDAPADTLRSGWPAGPALLLGHLRLAIIDLVPASNQPLLRGTLALSFNGEIYNYLELRAELAALGHTFATQGDSEVILAAYQQWGRDCVHRLRGMFAFAIHDRAAGTLWLARDRFAIKPLHFAERAGRLVFASEAKALPLLLGERPVVNDRQLYHLLVHGCNAFDRDCFYEGLGVLLPGEDILVDLATLQLAPRRYYDLREIVPGLEPLPAADDTVALFRTTFDEALALHLRADVPIGVGLSGGLDSSSLLGTIAARHLAGGREVTPATAARGELLPACQAFSSVFAADRSVDEAGYVRAMLDFTGVPGHSVTPAFDPLMQRLPALSRTHDQPLTSPSLLVQHSVMELAKAHGVTVVLNGQGGDELLGGYLRFIVMHTLGQLRRNPLRGAGLTVEMLLRGDPMIPGVILRSLLRRRSALGSQRKGGLVDLLQPGRFARFAGEPHPAPLSLDLQRLRESELQQFPIPSLCQNEDRNSMFVSLESRVPLLDHVLVECGLRLPPALLFQRGLGKAVLRRAMRGRVPEQVLWRRNKLGFPAPEQRWLGQLSHRDFRARLTAADALGELLVPTALTAPVWEHLGLWQRWLLLATDAWLGTLA